MINFIASYYCKKIHSQQRRKQMGEGNTIIENDYKNQRFIKHLKCFLPLFYKRVVFDHFGFNRIKQFYRRVTTICFINVKKKVEFYSTRRCKRRRVFPLDPPPPYFETLLKSRDDAILTRRAV